MQKSILITGGGCPGWFDTYKSLAKYKNEYQLLACDANSDVPSQIFVPTFTVPYGDNEKDYLSFIGYLINKYNIEIILPLTDPELITLSKHKSSFPKTLISVSDVKDLEIMSNKEVLYKTFPDISPQFISLNDSYLSSKTPFYLKNISSYGSRGTKKIVSHREWLLQFEKSKPEKFGSIFPIGELNYLFNTIGKKNYIAVENLPGAEYSIDCVFRSNSKLCFYGVRERAITNNGICSQAKFTVDKDKEFLVFIQKLQEKLDFKYNINIQAKRDQEGKLKLLEINPRISGSLGSFLSIGYNLVDYNVKLIQNRSTKCYPITPQSYPHSTAYRVSSFFSDI